MREISRRRFLEWFALSAGLWALSKLRLPAGANAALGAVPTSLRVLSAREAATLEAVIERMMRGGDPVLPPVADTAAVAVIDWALGYAGEPERFQLRWLLRAFEWSPPLLLGRFAPFTALSPEDQDVVLEAWERSRFRWMQLGFRALKNLSALGYYSQDRTWTAIGYRGPWMPRAPRSPRAAEER
jgi:hypothetical protein